MKFRFSAKKIYLLIPVLLCTLLNNNQTIAQTSKPVKILFLIDGSSSMLDDWQPNTMRFTAASNIVSAIMDSIAKINPQVQYAIRVFGHQYPMMQKNCFDTKLEVPFNPQNQEQIKARLKYLAPMGVSPIAWSLKQAAENDFINSDKNAYSIILITDGGESCGGNICETVEQLIQNKITFRPYILSLIDYAPLKKEYDCLGKYLTVAQPNQIANAVKTIVDDNKVMYEKNDGNLVINKPVEKPAAAVKIDTPIASPTLERRPVFDLILKDQQNYKINPLPNLFSFKKINNTAVKTVLEKVVFIEPEPVVVATPKADTPLPKVALIFAEKQKYTINSLPNLFSLKKINNSAAKTVLEKVVFIEPEPVVVATPKADTPLPKVALIFTEKQKYTINLFPSLFSLKKINNTAAKTVLEKVVFIEPEPVVVAIPKVDTPRPKVALIFNESVKYKINKLPSIIVFPEAKPIANRSEVAKVVFANPDPITPVVAVPKSEPVKPATPKPHPPTTPKQDEETAKVTTEKQKSEDTKVLVYFTNGKGKFYKTEPKIDFYDVKTKKIVQSNYRFINKTTGEPEPIKIPAGTYMLTKMGTRFKSAQFTVEEQTTEKLVITVSRGSFSFEYDGNKNRPMKEYTALISNRFEPGPVVKQACDTMLEFEPGKYHIEINTLPPSMRYTELNFMETRVITLPEPGTISITNKTLFGKIEFQYQQGEAFVPFYTMELNGNADKQKENFLPGTYRVLFFKNGKDNMKEFQIKRNTTTSLEL